MKKIITNGKEIKLKGKNKTIKLPELSENIKPKRIYKKRKIKLKLNYLIPFSISTFIILCTLLFVLIFIKINLNNYNNLEKQIKILKNNNVIQEEMRTFISENIKMLDKCKGCKMNNERKIQFLGLLFIKSLKYREKYYFKPKFALYQIRQESGFNEDAKGKADELTIYQFHPSKRKTACKIYGITENEFLKNLEVQTDYYYYLMTNYLECYNGDLDKALLTYNGGEGFIEAFNGNIGYLKKVVYLEHPKNPRKPYSDTIIKQYREDNI